MCLCGDEFNPHLMAGCLSGFPMPATQSESVCVETADKPTWRKQPEFAHSLGRYGCHKR